MRGAYGLRIPLRDGVELVADLYLPEGAERSPIVFTATPYGKNAASVPPLAERYTRDGYGLLIADVRGRGDSGGVFEPYRNEGRDWHDAIEWAAAQPWSTGDIATYGASYGGAAQWLAALEQPEHLRAMLIYCSPSDPFLDYPTGVHFPMEASWFRLVDGRAFQNNTVTDWNRVYEHLPLGDMDRAAGFTSAPWRRDHEHTPGDAEYWGPLVFQPHLDRVRVPALVVTGWYDDVQRGSTETFARLLETGDPEFRGSHRLVMGPWDHDAGRSGGRSIGDHDFGDHAEDVRMSELEIRFLDRHLRGADSPGVDDTRGGDHGVETDQESDPRVRLFLLGADEWREESEWPPASAVRTELHLTSSGGANGSAGDGELSLDPIPEHGSDSYRYDPLDPVPFLMDAASMQVGGPDDYSEVELRQDVLVYAGGVLEAPVDVIGQVSVELFVSSDRPDTDFMAKLVDIHPDGTRLRVCDGMVRARYRQGLEHEVFLEPDRVVAVTIDLWSTAQRFDRGHRIGLEIASSAFPKYNRNLNTGGPLAWESEPLVALNRVWHGDVHPSRLILPIVTDER